MAEVSEAASCTAEKENRLCAGERGDLQFGSLPPIPESHCLPRALAGSARRRRARSGPCERFPGTELTPDPVRSEVALAPRGGSGGVRQRRGAAAGQSGGEAEPGFPSGLPSGRRAVESWEARRPARRGAARAAGLGRGAAGLSAAPGAPGGRAARSPPRAAGAGADSAREEAASRQKLPHLCRSAPAGVRVPCPRPLDPQLQTRGGFKGISRV